MSLRRKRRASTRKKRIVVIADMHCGHRFGLTPPSWQLRDVVTCQHSDLVNVARKTWDAYAKLAEELGPVDYLFILGDSIDGKATKSGSTELLTADRHEQVDMAIECISVWGKPTIRMVHGTAYHSGIEEDWESVMADKLRKGYKNPESVSIRDHDYPEVNGLVFDLKHNVGGSSIPYGRHTSIAKSDMWNALHSLRQSEPRAKFFIRAHLHYYAYCGDILSTRINMPALQGAGSKFGGRMCEGTTDLGLLHIDVVSEEDFSWEVHTIAAAIPVRSVILK